MPWKEIEVSPESNGPIPRLGGVTQEDFRRALSEMRGEILGELKKDLRSMDKRLASLESDAWQPRLAMVADGQANTKTRKFTEGVVKAVQAMHGNGFSANRADPSPKTNSTSVGMKAESPALPRRYDVPIRVFNPWRCANQQQLVAHFPPAKPLWLRGPL